MTDDPVAVSADWLRAVRRAEPTHAHETRLRDWSRADLRDRLDTDAARLAFWTNVYNATAQSVLAVSPEQWAARNRFFSVDIATVAGRDLSLDAIEHGLLRRSHPKWGLGYVHNPFPSNFERTFRVTERDPRVHFALNCGAAACPPIAAYSRDGIDGELDAATRSHLDGEVAYDPDGDSVALPRIFLWFRGDFGGRGGILAFLRRYDCVPADATPSFTYRSYDWSLDRGNWRRGR
ncbi:DUF547 domain-containing protein [Halorarius halobius]|uniref:DUF547 domain-containing protein n=1 Tax=Halorarius halobius TaxID=2962671 RepID=UPI0020CC6BC9|nr:DUF547 domain-containing protein [Halorarius halobius]